MRCFAALAALLVATSACDKRDPAHASPTDGATPPGLPSSAPPARDAASVDAATLTCAPDPAFPTRLDVPEASAAAEVELVKGVRELLVVADSTRDGAALAYAIPDGPSRSLRLPLDRSVTDDVEGLAWHDGRLYALVSAGYVERFTPDGAGGLTRDGPAYPLGAPPYVSPRATQAFGKPPDFEGLCLRSAPSASRCAGYAASRAYGWLVCLVFDGERLRVDPVHPRLALDVKSESLSDCAFGAAGGPAERTLLVTTNIRGGSIVYRADEATGALSPVDVEGTMNNEAIAVDREGRLYQLADAQIEHSPSLRAICTGW